MVYLIYNVLMNRQTNKQFGIWKCVECGVEKPATAHQKRKKYCSNKCVSAAYKIRLIGENNGNYKNAGIKICCVCQKQYKNYNKRSRYCSIKCRDVEGNDALRHNARKDANHNAMVEALVKGGAVVKDTSKLMQGFPDLLVWYMDKWHLVEIKNPETSYGKKGLSKSQEKFANEWKGGPVMIIRTQEDVDKFLIGEFEELNQVRGQICL